MSTSNALPSNSIVHDYGANNLPLYAITGLSHILTTHEACEILGEPTVRSIVRYFLRCTASLVPPNNSSASHRRSVIDTGTGAFAGAGAGSGSGKGSESQSKRTSQPLGIDDFHKMPEILEPNEIEDETYWINLFTAALSFNFDKHYKNGITNTSNNSNSTSNNGNKSNSKKGTSTSSSISSEKVPTWCRTTWHRLLNLPPSQTYQNLTLHQQQNLQTLNQKIPFPLLGLDKSSFLKSGIMFPNCIAPHAGPKGHLALMECIFNAVASPPPTVLLNRVAKVSNMAMKSGFKGVSKSSSSGAGANTSSSNTNSTSQTSGTRSSFSSSSSEGSSTRNRTSQSSHAHGSNSNNNNSHESQERQWKEYMRREYARAMVEGPAPGVMQRETNAHLKTNSRTIVLLPDLIIYWAIVVEYQKIFSNSGRSAGATTTTRSGGVEAKDAGDGNIPIGVGIKEGKEVENLGNRLQVTRRGNATVALTAKLCFRVYDGFQKDGAVTRDTFHRFLSDIHGEETHMRSNVKHVLDRMFAIQATASEGGKGPGKGDDLPARHLTQLTESQFIQAMQKTVRVAHGGVNPPFAIEHILFDWFVRLGESLMPHYLPDMERFFTSTPQNVGIGTLLQAKLDLVRSKTADTAIKKLYRQFDILDDGVGSRNGMYREESARTRGSRSSSSNQMHLFDVKRRFQSIVANVAKGNDIRGDCVRYESCPDDRSRSTSSSSIEEEGHHLPIEECDETSPSKTSTLRIGDLPRNAIDEDAFVHVISTADNDLGHGGFIPPKAARLLFQAGCLKSEENMRRQSSRTNLNTLMNIGDQGTNMQNKVDVLEKNYWEFHDVLAFGCNAVRGELVAEDSDKPILECMFLMFTLLPSIRSETPSKTDVPQTIETTQQPYNVDSRFMTRGAVGQMLLMLLEHFSFRLQADSAEGSDEDNHISNIIDVEKSQVDASAASLLGLLPSSIGDESTDDRQMVPLELLVDQVYEEAGKNKEDPMECLRFGDFVEWSQKNSDPNKSMDKAEQKINPLLTDLRLIGSIVFGIKPVSPILERLLVDEVQHRFKYRYPSTALSKRGPAGTIWYIIEITWWKEWLRYSEDSLYFSLPKITNNQLLVDNGNIALRAGLRFRSDFEVCA